MPNVLWLHTVPQQGGLANQFDPLRGDLIGAGLVWQASSLRSTDKTPMLIFGLVRQE